MLLLHHHCRRYCTGLGENCQLMYCKATTNLSWSQIQIGLMSTRIHFWGSVQWNNDTANVQCATRWWIEDMSSDAEQRRYVCLTREVKSESFVKWAILRSNQDAKAWTQTVQQMSQLTHKSWLSRLTHSGRKPLEGIGAFSTYCQLWGLDWKSEAANNSSKIASTTNCYTKQH